MRILTPAGRLAVAVDSVDLRKNLGANWMRRSALRLAKEIAHTGTWIKLESLVRACGYQLISDIGNQGVKVFADLKLLATVKTLKNDGAFLREHAPAMLTVAMTSDADGIRALKSLLPETRIVGVAVLTSFDDAASTRAHGGSVVEAMSRLADLAIDIDLDGLICAPRELKMLRPIFGPEKLLVATNVRPVGVKIDDGQNQDREGTPAQAIHDSADMIVVGGPIMDTDDPSDVTSQVNRIRQVIKEIEFATHIPVTA